MASKTTRLELVDGKSSKFWELRRDGATLTVTFGRLGTKGQQKQLELADADSAKKEAAKRIAAKRKKGYAEPATAEPPEASKAAANADAKTETVEVSIIRKGRHSGTEFLPGALATDGEELFVHSWVRLYHRVGSGRLKEVGEFGTLEDYREALLHAGPTLWACGSAGLSRSEDGGETFEPVPLPQKGTMVALARDSEGGLWVGGGIPGGGALFHRGPRAARFTTVKGPSTKVTCLAQTSKGIVVGDRDGALWVASRGKAQRLHDAKREVRTVFETDNGTLLVVVGAPEQIADLALLRSKDGGETFEEHALGELSILTFSQLPEGPIVVGAEWGAIGLSGDDGRSFETLSHEASYSGGQSFGASCVYDGAVLLGGPFNNLVEVRVGAGSARAKSTVTAKKKTKRKRRRGRGYVASGRFAKDLAAALGVSPGRRVSRGDGVQAALDELPAALASELEALHDLLHGAKGSLSLCGLRLGGWVSLPAQYGMDAEAVLEAEWFGDPEDAELVASSIEIFNDQGSPFVVVGAEGVFLLSEDPYEYWQVADDLEAFLRVLIAVEAAVRGEVSVDAAEELLTEHIYVDEEDRHPRFFERTLELARSR